MIDFIVTLRLLVSSEARPACKLSLFDCGELIHRPDGVHINGNQPATGRASSVEERTALWFLCSPHEESRWLHGSIVVGMWHSGQGRSEYLVIFATWTLIMWIRLHGKVGSTKCRLSFRKTIQAVHHTVSSRVQNVAPF